MANISVIIPVYNSSKYLSEAIETVLAQTYRDFEIIIVDDGSRDNSKEIIQRFLDKFPDKIRYIYQQNKGIAGARNSGIKNAQGKFIALLDADDKWHPEKLQAQIGVIESDRDIGLVHGNIMNISERGEFLAIPKRNKKYLSGRIFKPLFLRNADIACLTTLFRRECCEKVGLFDENPVCMGCDDRDLWLRIAEKYRIEYIDKVLGYYRVHQTNYSKNIKNMLSARLYVVNKFIPPGRKISLLRNRALARIYKEFGDKLLFGKDFKCAKRQYLEALSIWPLCIGSWINLFKSFFRICRH